MKNENLITERIKTFEDACKELNEPASLLWADSLPEKHRRAIIAFYKLIMITEALNEGWTPDFLDGPQNKYWPWFYFGANAGFGSLYAYYVASDTSAAVGARLCYKSRSLAVYSGTQFIDLWQDYLILKEI